MLVTSTGFIVLGLYYYCRLPCKACVLQYRLLQCFSHRPRTRKTQKTNLSSNTDCIKSSAHVNKRPLLFSYRNVDNLHKTSTEISHKQTDTFAKVSTRIVVVLQTPVMRLTCYILLRPTVTFLTSQRVNFHVLVTLTLRIKLPDLFFTGMQTQTVSSLLKLLI